MSFHTAWRALDAMRDVLEHGSELSLGYETATGEHRILTIAPSGCYDEEPGGEQWVLADRDERDRPYTIPRHRHHRYTFAAWDPGLVDMLAKHIDQHVLPRLRTQPDQAQKETP